MLDQKIQLILGLIILSWGLIASSYLLTIDPSGFTASIAGNRPGVKEFNIVMQNNRYNPSQINVNQGDQVILNITNRDSVSHGVDLPQFGASIPGGHVQPGQTAQLDFIANRKGVSDAASCGGGAFKQTDTHGEELIVNVI